MAQAPSKRQILKTSLNANSFNKMLNDRIKGRGEGITLIQVLEFARRTSSTGLTPPAIISRVPGSPGRRVCRPTQEARGRFGNGDQRHRRSQQLYDRG
jgi:hypothetical protein